MKAIRICTTIASLVLLGITCPAFAGQEHQGEKQDRPQRGEAPHQQASPQQQHAQQQPQQHVNQPQQHAQPQPRPVRSQPQQHAEQQPHQAQNQPERRSEQQSRPVQSQRQEHVQQQGQTRHPDHAQEQRASTPHQQPQERQRAWQDHRAGNWQSDHRDWRQRGGYTGYRIPEARFSGYFGSSNGFRIGGLPFLVVGGYPRFQYGGYWFSMVDPWPGDWSDDWYDTDDVYVNYQDNGYYLFDRRHPGVGIAISVSM